MRAVGIVGVRLGKKVTTTVPAPDAAQVPDLLQRDFTASEPNTKYVGHITYLPVGDGQFLYLATVLDFCSKRLAGWAIADSENGARYASKDFAKACRALRVIRSRGAVGTSADNAAAESFNAAPKRETLHGRKHWPGVREARLAVFRRITRYNTGEGIRRSARSARSPSNSERIR